MTQKTNSFERFWKELKRRKVVHVITVYAAVAFVILQRVDIVAEPLRLPSSTKALVIVLLCIGFVIAVFLSWVYDITPAGVKKTKPVSAVKHGDQITSPASSGWKIATYVSVVIIVALIAFNILSRNKSGNLIKLEKTIAVLPFRNLSNDTTQIYFCDGFMEEILNNLQTVKSFTVRSRTSSDQYRDTKKSSTIIGNELNANYLVEGSVGNEGNNLKIWVQLIDSKADKHVWSNDYTREMKQIFSLQSEIAKDIANQLKAILSPEEIEKIEKKPTENIEAYNLYWQGRFFWNKRTAEGLKKSVEYFEKSIEKDPDYALAYAGVADAYCILAWWGWVPRSEGYARSKKFAIKALEIDKDLAEAHATLGDILCWSEWKWEDARKQLKLATELNPNYATAHQYYSEILDIIGNNDEARSQINIAVKLDPFSAAMNGASALYYYHEHKFRESLDVCRKTMEINPDFIGAYWTSFDAYIKMGENLNAAKVLQQLMLRDTLTLKVSSILKEVYTKSGINGILNWLIEWQKNNPAANLYLAKWCSMLGRKEEALDRLEKALKERLSEIPGINSLPDEIPRIYNSPDYENLRSEPRFLAIIKKMGLSEYTKKE
jgi:TolB-like protein